MIATLTIKQALTNAVFILNAAEEARTGSEILLAFVLKQSKAYLYTHPDKILSETETHHFNELIEKRRQGMPIAYLTGTREFWSLPLKVTEATLIPRPETELLVELTLDLLGSIESAQILDLGTGTGAVALALAKENPNWNILACDKSDEALQIAKENAHQLQINNVVFIHSDWFTAIPIETKFHGIISNPPYIASDDTHLEQGDLRFEPLSALASDQNGLKDLHLIIKQSISRLKKNGLLLVEHGYDQKNAVNALFNKYGYKEVKCWQDWQSNDRISGGLRIEVDE